MDLHILEHIEWKGENFEEFKAILLKRKVETEELEASISHHENELETSESELQSLQDQINYSSRNISDAITSQVTSKHSIEHMKQQNVLLQQTEIDTRIEIENYKKSFDEFKSLLNNTNEWPEDKLELKNELEAERAAYRKDLDYCQDDLLKIRTQLENVSTNVSNKEAQLVDLLNNIEITEKKIASSNEYKLKYETEIALKKKRESDLKAEISQLTKTMYEKSKYNRSEDTSILDLESRVSSLKNEMDSCVKTYDVLFRQLQSFTNEIENLRQSNEKVELEISERLEYIELRKSEIVSMKKENEHYKKLYELTIEKTATAESDKIVVEEQKYNLLEKMKAVHDKDMIAVNRQIEIYNSQIANCKNQLAIIDKKQLNAESSLHKLDDLIMLNVNGKKILENELLRCIDDVNRIHHEIEVVTKEKDTYEHEIEVLNAEYYTFIEENRLYDIQIKDLAKTLKEYTVKLKQKQSTYDTVRIERNVNAKELWTYNNEINQLKLQYRELNHSITQVKKEIFRKEKTHIKETFYHATIDKEIDTLKNENLKVIKQIESSDTLIKEQRDEISKCRKILENIEEERYRLSNEHRNMVLERNMLTAHVVKRNNEIKDLYNTIKSKYSLLTNGEQDYYDINNEIKKYQNELIEVVKNHEKTVNEISNLNDLNHQIIQLENELHLEKIKKRALSDELTRPINVHRWRIIQSADPIKFEKIMKIQTLQKVLIEKTGNYSISSSNCIIIYFLLLVLLVYIAHYDY